jgi:hypothetical protein
MEMSRQLHTPAALSRGKEPLVPIGQEDEWASELVWLLWRREKPLPYRELKRGIPFRCPSLCRLSYSGSINIIIVRKQNTFYRLFKGFKTGIFGGDDFISTANFVK